MPEENVNEPEETAAIESPENDAEESAAPRRKSFFSRRNALIAVGTVAFLAIALVILVTISYRNGVVDDYVKRQFVQKMADIGIVFNADVFRVTVNPLQLQLENATFVNKVTGEKLFTVNKALLNLKVQDLYSWQLSRDINVDSTVIDGLEAWVNFDENGKSNFAELVLVEEEPGRFNFKYSSVNVELRNGTVHFGDVQRKISADARNVTLLLEPTNPNVAEAQMQFKVDFTSTDSNVVYDGNAIQPVNIRATGIADENGAQISELKLDTPIGSSVLTGTVSDWKDFKYDLRISSTVDLTQASTVLPLGTPLRGVGNFEGTVTGTGEQYKIDGAITSDALSASNIYLKALNVAATVEGTNSMYEVNGKAVAELLTFEDFRIDYPQLVGNVRGTGTDFRWVGELQAAGAKSPLGTIGGLYVGDAVAEYKDKQLSAELGSVRAVNLTSPEISAQDLRTGSVKIVYNGNRTYVLAPTLRASSIKTDDVNLQNVTAGGVEITNQNDATTARVNNVTAGSLTTEDARLRNVSAQNVRVNSGATTRIDAQKVQAGAVEASGASIGALTATGVTAQIAGDETRVYSDNLNVARLETDAAVLGSLNVAGVRLTVRSGRIEGSSGNINAGDVRLTNEAIAGGGKLENVRLNQPVFVLEPSGRYRASADMSLGGGVLGSINLGAARASVNASSERIELNNLTADVMDGRLSGAATIALGNNARSNINTQFTDLDLGKLLALQGGRVVPLEGKTTGQVNLSFPGTNFKRATGTASADIAANAGTAERGLVPVSGRVEVRADNGLFNVDAARITTGESQLSATGQFDLNGYNSNLNVALNSTNAAEIERIVRVLNLSPELETQLDSLQVELAGNLSFTGNITGNLTDPAIEGRAALETLRVRGQNLGSLATDVSVTSGGIALNNGLLTESDGGTLAFNVSAPNTGTNNASVQAKLDRVNIGNLLAALPFELPANIRNLRADTSGTVNISGIPNQLQGEANITSTGGTIDGQAFDNLEARASFAGNLVTIENFEAKFGAGFVRAAGNYNTETSAIDLNVTGKDVLLERLRPFIPNGADLPNIKGTADLTAQITGRADQPSTYNVNFSGVGRDITLDDRALGQVEFSGTTENQQLNARIAATINGQRQEIAANVNFGNENLPFRAETVFNDTDLTPYIALARPPGEVEISGRATGRVLLEGNLRALNAEGTREFSTAGLRGSAEFTQLALQIDETPLIATEPVAVRFTPSEVIVENAKFAGGGTNVAIAGTVALTGGGTNNLSVDGSVNLRVLNAISENAFFSGIANVEVRLSGTSASPRLLGSAAITNASAAVFVSNERLTLQRINGRVLFTSNQAQIQELTGYLGGGRITASGGALLEGLQLNAFRFNVQGDNFTAPVPPDFVTTGDAQIEITGRRTNGLLETYIAGAITAKRSVYTEDIDLSDIIGQRRQGSISQSGGGSGDSFLGETRLDIRIVGRDALVVRNNVADLTASIDLRVTGNIDDPQIAGRVSANSGTVLFRNDRYEVQRGFLEFPPGGGINPYINLQAEAEIRGYQVVVNLVGDLTDTESLNATVRSSPALPQADVISLITTGNLSNTTSGIPTLAQSGINTAAEILTDALINNPARKATDRLFGLNVFEIDPIISGQRLGASARLTVGRQINKNLLVTYSTNLSQDQNQVLALEYRVSNRLSFVAQYEQRSLSNVTQANNNFSFEIRLRKRF